MTAIGHEARAAAVLANLRRRHERVEVHQDHGDFNRLSAEINAIRAIITDLPKALASLSDRIAALEQFAIATGDVSVRVLQSATELQQLSERLRFVETGWLPYEETMRSHHAKRSA
jgi:hypothetical protein